MSWEWTTQTPHPSGPKDQKLIHILVGTDLATGEQTYLAFVSVEANGFKSLVPSLGYDKKKLRDYHYTHDSLQEAKDYCVAELVNRRLT